WQVERAADARPPVDLGRRDVNQVYGGPLRERDAVAPERLHGVDVDQRVGIPLLDQAGEFGDRLHGPGLVVDVHDRGEDGARVDAGRDRGRIDAAVGVDGDDPRLTALAL